MGSGVQYIYDDATIKATDLSLQSQIMEYPLLMDASDCGSIKLKTELCLFERHNIHITHSHIRRGPIQK